MKKDNLEFDINHRQRFRMSFIVGRIDFYSLIIFDNHCFLNNRATNTCVRKQILK